MNDQKRAIRSCWMRIKQLNRRLDARGGQESLRNAIALERVKIQALTEQLEPKCPCDYCYHFSAARPLADAEVCKSCPASARPVGVTTC